MTLGPAVEEASKQRRDQAVTMADPAGSFCPGWMSLESSMVPWKEHWTEIPRDCVSQGRLWPLSGPAHLSVL